MRIESDEWRRVVALIDAGDPVETADQAVWLVDDGHLRRWAINNSIGVLFVDGASTSGRTTALGLSPRLVRFANHLANTAGACTLTVVDGTTAVIEGAGTAAAVDLIDGTPPHQSVIPCEGATQATLPATSLASILHGARQVPSGVDLDSPAGNPHLWLALDDNTATAHVDWRPAGASRCTYRTASQTVGDRRMIAVNHPLLTRVVDHLADPDGDITLTVTDDDEFVASGTDWQAWIPTYDGSVLRLAAELDQVLRSAGIEAEWVSGRAAEFGHPCRVRAELHGGDYEIVRISTIVATGVDPSPEVYAELNQANAGLVGVRLWIDDDAVVAASDVACERLPDVVPVAARLVCQVAGLGVFLSALVGASGAATDD